MTNVILESLGLDLTPYPRQLSFFKKTVWYWKTVVYLSTRHFAGKLYIYCLIFPELTCTSKIFFSNRDLYYFTLSEEIQLQIFIARYYVILFGCLVTLRMRGKSVVRVSFDTENNILLERGGGGVGGVGVGAVIYASFLRYGSVTDDLTLIQSA